MSRMGNRTGKSRVNVFLSAACRKRIDDLIDEYGVSATAVIEIAVLKFHRDEFPDQHRRDVEVGRGTYKLLDLGRKRDDST